MFSAIRKRIHLTPSTAIAFVALVFALTGGAFAATGAGNGPHATIVATAAKAKAKSGPRGPAGPKGATGAPGAKGANGANGATGAAGPAGAEGKTGAEGKPGERGQEGLTGEAAEAVKSAQIPAGNEHCKEGGSELTAEGNVKTYVCNGHEGKDGTPGVIHPGETLPAGASETGVWNAHLSAPAGAFQSTTAPISFTIKLKTAPKAYYFTEAQTEKGEFEVNGKATGCQGNASNPESTVVGTLCVFTGFSEEAGWTNVTPRGVFGVLEEEGVASITGGFLKFSTKPGPPSSEETSMTAIGSWAVDGD